MGFQDVLIFRSSRKSRRRVRGGDWHGVTGSGSAEEGTLSSAQ